MALTETYANFDLATGANDGSSEANAWQSWASITHAAGSRCNIKRCASRQSLGTITMSTSGTAGNPCWLRGYGSTPGDGTKFQWSGDLTQSGDGVILECLDCENSSGTARMYYLTGQTRIVSCRAVHTLTGSAVFAPIAITGAGSAVLGCEASIAGNRAGSDGSAITTSVYAAIHGGFVKGSGNAQAITIATSFESSSLIGTAIDGNGDDGVLINGGDPRGVVMLSGNSVYNCADGVSVPTVFAIGGDGSLILVNNIIYSCSGYGVNNSSGTNLVEGLLVNNAMGSLTSDRLNGFGNVDEINPISLSGDPWTDAANGDFTLNNTAGAGAAVRGLVYPADYGFTGSRNAFGDLGALQHQDSGGGGGTNGWVVGG